MKELLGVLVLYKCRLEDSPAFITLEEALVKSGDTLDLLVYDNTPEAQIEEQHTKAENIKIIYVADPHNPGVSKAYNVGADYARKNNKEWLLLMDQDTCFPSDAAGKYKDHIQRRQQVIGAPVLGNGAVCISPCKYRWGRGKALKNYQLGKNSFKSRSLLNSGLLIPLDLFYKAGGYNERIALDFSDHYFIEAVKKINSYFYLLDILCTHALSACEMDKNKVHARFIYYLKGAAEYNRKKSSWGLEVMVVLRTIKLTLRFRSVIFLKTYWKERIA